MSRLPLPRAFLFVAFIAALCVGVSCTGTDNPHCEEELALRVMSYNLAQLRGDDRNYIIAQIRRENPDLLALQECSECEELAEVLSTEYALRYDEETGVGYLYDPLRFRETSHQREVLGANDDGWGTRVQLVGRFVDIFSESEFRFASTHWCVPIRSDSDLCDEARHLQYAAKVSSDENCPTLVAGDFNLFGTSEQVLSALAETGMVDTFQRSDDADLGETFTGNLGFPPARIDYILSNNMPSVRSAQVLRDQRQNGPNSDHYPIVADIFFPSNVSEQED